MRCAPILFYILMKSKLRSEASFEGMAAANLDSLGPRNDDDVVSLRQKPGESYLSRRYTSLFCDVTNLIDHLKDPGKVLFGVPKHPVLMRTVSNIV